MHNVSNIRGYVLRKVKHLKIYISSLQPFEHDAMAALDGMRGQETAAKIADFVLEQLGHKAPKDGPARDSPTLRAARQIIGKGKEP